MSWSAFEWILQPQLNCSKASIGPWIELAFSSFWTWCSWASSVTPCSSGRKQSKPGSIDPWPLKWCLKWGNLDSPKRWKKTLFWESIEKLRSNANYFERPAGPSKVAAWLMSYPWLSIKLAFWQLWPFLQGESVGLLALGWQHSSCHCQWSSFLPSRWSLFAG